MEKPPQNSPESPHKYSREYLLGAISNAADSGDLEELLGAIEKIGEEGITAEASAGVKKTITKEELINIAQNPTADISDLPPILNIFIREFRNKSVENVNLTEDEANQPPVDLSLEEEGGSGEFLGKKVQWNSGGTDMLEKNGKTVTGISPDGKFVFVEGSNAGIPTEEISIVQEKEEKNVDDEQNEGFATTEGGWARSEKIERIEKKETTPEKILEAIDKSEKNTEEKSKTMGLLDFYRWTGERIKKLPTKTKLAIGLGFAGLAIASGGASVAIGGAAIWRAISSAGMFVTAEEALRYSYEKEGKERSKVVAGIHTAEAFIFSVLVGGGATGQAAHNIFEYFNPPTNPLSVTNETENAKKIAKAKISGGDAPTGLRAFDEGVAKNLTEEYEIPKDQLTSSTLEKNDYQNSLSSRNYSVEKGDNLYKIIKNQFPEVQGLSGGKQTNAIENILAEIKKDPTLYGIKSGDVNKLAIGENIDVEKIKEILENKTIGGKNIIDHAEGLSKGAVDKIESWEPPTVGIPHETATPMNSSSSLGWENFAHEEKATPEKEIGGAFAEQEITTPDNLAQKNIAPNEEFYTKVVKYFDNPEKASLDGFNRLDLAALEDAREIMKVRLDGALGKPGFLGIGGTSGANSETWLKWKDHSMADLFKEKNPTEDVIKLQNLIEKISKESELIPSHTAKIETLMKEFSFYLTKNSKNIIT